MKNIKGFWELLKDTAVGFRRHKVLKLSSSLAYFTIFTLGPLMIVVLFLSNLYWGQKAIEGKIYKQISEYVGDKTAHQIEEIIKNTSVSGNGIMAVVGIIVLIIAATTAFAEMHDSINIIWNLRVKKGNSWKQLLKSRLLSFTMVAGLSFLLLLSLILNGLLEGFIQYIKEVFPQINFVIIYVANLLITLLVVAMLFAIIYKVLPDAIIKWKDVAAGAIFAAVLFMIGKFGITFYIRSSDMGSSYGSAGSSIILLFWIFYSSTILYFGAEFTKAYAMKYGSEIKPKKNAVTIRVVQVESNETSVQNNEKNINEMEKKEQDK